MSLLAPDIKKRNFQGPINDGTPQKGFQKPKVDLSQIGKSELRLPYIAKQGNNFSDKKKSVALPPKKDFFKLVTPANVEIE